MGRKFSTASEHVTQGIEDDFTAVCEVLAGQSPWQEFIRPNVGTAIKKYPWRSFNIVSSQAFNEEGSVDPETMGYTNKVKLRMVFIQKFERGDTVMAFTLHEMVHWVSHPPDQGRRVTAWGLLEDGLAEGLTQVVTEDILDKQNISRHRPASYPDRVAIVRKLIERFGVRPFGEALFGGHVDSMTKPLVDTYGTTGLLQIRRLANANNSKKAIECIDNLNRAFDASQKKGAAIRR